MKTMPKTHVFPECLHRETSVFGLGLKNLLQTGSRVAGPPIEAFEGDGSMESLSFVFSFWFGFNNG